MEPDATDAGAMSYQSAKLATIGSRIFENGGRTPIRGTSTCAHVEIFTEVVMFPQSPVKSQ
jgi:hypothetical protein